MNVFDYMPLELWKDMAERFLDPTSFGRLRQVNKALKNKLDYESKEKMIKRCTFTLTMDDGEIVEYFLNRKHVIKKCGENYWYRCDKLHRDDDLPAFTSKYWQGWYNNDLLHRINGPAVIKAVGTKEWYQNSKLHRLDGPAITFGRPLHRAMGQLIVERAGEDPGGRGLADAAYAGQDPGLGNPSGLERIGDRAHHGFLADQIIETGGAYLRASTR